MRSVFFLLLASSLFACSGDHDALAARPGEPRDSGKVDDKTIVDAGTEADPGLEAGDSAHAPDAEGPSSTPFSLTFVHGMPDASAIRLCLVPRTGAGEDWDRAGSFPDDPDGLAYGRSHVLDGALGAAFVDDDLAVYVIAGALAETSAKPCAELVPSKDEGVVVRAMPILPSGFFAVHKSVLLVATGCVFCEVGLDALPTANLVGAAMSQASSPVSIGIQGVHALPRNVPVVMEIHPDSDLVPWEAFSYLPPGAIAPGQLPSFHKASSFGADWANASIVVKDGYSLATIGSFPLGQAFERGGLGRDDFTAGRSFTLVALGPVALAPESQAASGPWRGAFAVVAVANDPKAP